MSKLTLTKTSLTTVITFVFASFLFTSNVANANTIKMNLDASNCVTSLSPSDKSSCATEFPGVTSPCEGKKDCVCTKKDKHIEWEFAENSKKQNFTIDFKKGSPFGENCKLASPNGNKIRCKIDKKGAAVSPPSFYYSVTIAACAAEPYDPIIIVGN
ncbi:hypothetical protein RGQ13_12995 [Thalassotalea psychrophila]|uniref:Ig-like domain-containing protein n=1 Tax=Thalassotalea psychrophila TaxID=3065647 RepID=A0ABY9TQF7_9GAMM|nr:hypothetical protein RGQ13_12995 [Colwelliaceae bacterium SQ149]